MNTKRATIFVVVSGVILLGIGGAILLAPKAFHASNGITLESNASLMSEMRAPGGLLFASGLVILTSLFLPGLRQVSLFLATFVYGTFGLSRLLSVVLDGLPSAGIVGAIMIELFLAAMGLWILTRKTSETQFDNPADLTSGTATVIH